MSDQRETEQQEIDREVSRTGEALREAAVEEEEENRREEEENRREEAERRREEEAYRETGKAEGRHATMPFSRATLLVCRSQAPTDLPASRKQFGLKLSRISSVEKLWGPLPGGVRGLSPLRSETGSRVWAVEVC